MDLSHRQKEANSNCSRLAVTMEEELKKLASSLLSNTGEIVLIHLIVSATMSNIIRMINCL